MNRPLSSLSESVTVTVTISPVSTSERVTAEKGETGWLSRRSRARPRFPVLIVAANKDVLDNEDPADRLNALDYKEVNPDNMDVLWKPDVYQFYQQHPERFASEHPQLRLGDDRRIGKALTFNFGK